MTLLIPLLLRLTALFERGTVEESSAETPFFPEEIAEPASEKE